MAGEWKGLAWAAAVSAAALLAACDNGPSAVGGKQAAGSQMASAQAPAAASSAQGEASDKIDHRKDPPPLLDGKPEWAASRRFSADERAHQAFERNGQAFGAKSFEDYVRKAHAFVEHPPKDVETLTRPNGDTLYYDAKDNIFAVADKSGLPRTMFKPDDGASYWQQQKDREAKRQTAQSKSHKSSSDDEA
jgi:pyocin large subunit-like protein